MGGGGMGDWGVGGGSEWRGEAALVYDHSKPATSL